MADALQLDVERLINLLAVSDSPLRERVVKHVEWCEPLPRTSRRNVLVFEAVAFAENMDSAAGDTSSFVLFDRHESQAMLDRCVEALIADANATCSLNGLDDLPNWLHNKVGRPLVGAMIVGVNEQMNRVSSGAEALRRVQSKRDWCSR